MTRAQVDQSLEEVVPIVDRPGPGQWRFTVPGAPGGVALGQVDEGWLRLVADIEGVSSDAWTLLEANAGLPVVIRYVLAPRAAGARLCADVCLDDPARGTARIREACESFASADLRRRDEPAVSDSAAQAETHHPTAAPGSLSRQVIEACGWPVAERDGRLPVPIGSLDGLTGSAQVRTLAADGLAFRTTLEVDVSGASDADRGALACCLLVTTAGVRGVRASAQRVGGQLTVGLECGLLSAPSEEETQSALSALSVAWHRCAREARALLDPRVAETYRRLCVPQCHAASDSVAHDIPNPVTR